MKLRKIHYAQLIDVLEQREKEGWYWGNKEQYEKRHQELKLWLEGLRDKARS